MHFRESAGLKESIITKKFFEENNVELPKTFDEFLDVCTTFQNAGVTPLAAGLKSWEPLLKSSMAFVTA